MYSGNSPPSFAIGAFSGFDQNEPQSTAPGVDYSQPPSHKDLVHSQENSYNQSRGLNQTAENIVDNNDAPSFPNMHHGQENSYNNQGPNISRGFGGDNNVSGTGGRPMSRSDLVKVNVSETSGGGGVTGEKAPSYGDMGQRGVSDTGPSAGDGFDEPDATEFEGMSMVARTFKKFHPNAYYKKEDEWY